MADVISGTNMRILVGTAGSEVAIAKAVTCQITWNSNFRDVVHKDNAGGGKYDEATPDGITGTAQTDGLYALDADGYKKLRDYQHNQTKFSLQYTDSTTGDERTTVSAYVVSVTRNATVRQNVTYSAQFRLVGAPTFDVIV